MRLLEVKSDEIMRLDENQLTQLLKLLLYLEARAFGISTSSVEVPLKINVSDGGKDGSIEWQSGREHTNYVPNRCTFFQCKATYMPKSACRKELLKEQREGEAPELKPAVKEVFDKNGTYILLNNRRIKDRTGRISEMRNELAEAGRDDHSTASIQIFDAEKIADWTNEYLPAATYVLECCGIDIPPSAQTWNSLSSQTDVQGNYHSNDFLTQQITSIRRELGKPRSVMRIKGHSGLGKTRLAFEAFRPTNDDDIAQATLNASILYCDASMDKGELRAFIANSRNRERHGVLVVDNCDLTLHNNLKREVTRTDCNLSLLTIDYGYEESEPPTIEARIHPDNLRDIVRKIVKEIYPSIDDSDLFRIEEFAQGFPKIAVLVAQARFSGSSEIGNLRDDEFLKKLIWRRRSERDIEYKVIKACSIFKYFGMDDNFDEQAKFIAELVCKVDYNEFFRICQQFLRDQMIMQRRGRFVAVLPKPVAITLAVKWWDEVTLDDVKLLIASVEKVGLIEPLCEQLRLMSFSKRAQELAGHLLDATSPFGQVETLVTKSGSRVFRALTELNPQAATDALYREFSSWSIENLLNIVDGRRNLIWALEKLCWWEGAFPKAASMMLLFAAAENESYGNNATNQFLQLFHLYLSGTRTPLTDRLTVIDEALGSGEVAIQELAIRALGSSLTSGHFARSGGAEIQGSRSPESDYQPKTVKEIMDYRLVCFERLEAVVLGVDEALSEIARAEIAKHLLGILQEGTTHGIDYTIALDKTIKKIIMRFGQFWPEAYDQLKQTTLRPHIILTSDVREKVDEWLALLMPEDIADKLRLIVGCPPWEHEKDESGHYIDKAMVSAERLAEQLGSLEPDWRNLLPILMDGEQRQGFSFGRKLGEVLKNPDIFITVALEILRTGQFEKPNTIVLCGFLSRLKDRGLVSKTLSQIFADDNLLRYSTEIARLSSTPKEDLDNLISLVEAGRISIQELNGFSFNSVLNHLSQNDILEFCKKIGSLGDSGMAAAFNILYMYSFDDSHMFELSEDTFRHWLLTQRMINECENGILDTYHWEEVCKRLLTTRQDTQLAESITIEITSACRGTRDVRRIYFKEILGILFRRYCNSVWSLFGMALLEEDYFLSENLIDIMGSDSIFSKPGPLKEVPERILLQWCESNLPHAPLIVLRLVPFFDISAYHDDERSSLRDAALALPSPSWYPLTKDLLENYGHFADVQKFVLREMTCFGWSGSPIPYYRQLITLLEALSDSPNTELRRWSIEGVEILRSVVREESRRESEHDIGVY